VGGEAVTQEFIDNLKRLRQQALDTKREAETKVAIIDAAVSAMHAKCDHTYPDGTTAYEGGWLFTECKICHDNDL
jgi:hypothetical protein